MSKKQIEKIQGQLNFLRHVKKKGEYLAAGLQIGFNVGVSESYDLDIEVGISSNIEEKLINLLIEGLESSKEVWIDRLRQETEENLNFLNQL